MVAVNYTGNFTAQQVAASALLLFLTLGVMLYLADVFGNIFDASLVSQFRETIRLYALVTTIVMAALFIEIIMRGAERDLTAFLV